MSDCFSTASLLLVGHGSTATPDSAAPVYQHAAELRRRQVFAEVHEAFWQQPPAIRAVLAQLTAPRVFILPLMISEGYFADEVIPREVGLSKEGGTGFDRVQCRGSQTLYYCAPVGTHPSMTGLILARAREAVERSPFPRAPGPREMALFIAGHGTGRNENSRRAVERQAELIRLQDVYGEVQAVFLEEDPRVADCYALAHARHVVMVPFFISAGLHADRDIPVLLGEPERVVRERLQNGQPAWHNPTERKGKLLWYARSVGSEPHLADVILERVREAARLI